MKNKKTNPEIKTILKEYNKDIKRHMSVLTEDFKKYLNQKFHNICFSLNKII